MFYTRRRWFMRLLFAWRHMSRIDEAGLHESLRNSKSFSSKKICPKILVSNVVSISNIGGPVLVNWSVRCGKLRRAPWRPSPTNCGLRGNPAHEAIATAYSVFSDYNVKVYQSRIMLRKIKWVVQVKRKYKITKITLLYVSYLTSIKCKSISKKRSNFMLRLG